MNELTDAFTVLAKVTTLLVIWYLLGSVFTTGFSIWKYFRALAELDKYHKHLDELKKLGSEQLIKESLRNFDDGRAN